MKSKKLFVVTTSVMVLADSVFSAIGAASKVAKKQARNGNAARGVVTNVATQAQTFVDLTGETPVVKPNSEAKPSERVIAYSAELVAAHTAPVAAVPASPATEAQA